MFGFWYFLSFYNSFETKFPGNLPYSEKEKAGWGWFIGRAYFVWLHVDCAMCNLDKIEFNSETTFKIYLQMKIPTNSVFWASFQFRVQIHVVTSKWHSNWILFNPEYCFYFPIPTKKTSLYSARNEHSNENSENSSSLNIAALHGKLDID